MDRETLANNVGTMYAVSDYTGQITMETCDPGGVLNRSYDVQIYTYDSDGHKVGRLETFKPGDKFDIIGKVPGNNNEFVIDVGGGNYALMDFITEMDDKNAYNNVETHNIKDENMRMSQCMCSLSIAAHSISQELQALILMNLLVA